MRLCLCLALVALGCTRDPDAAKGAARPKLFIGDTLLPLDQQGAAQEGGELRVAMEIEPPSLNFQLDPLDNWGKKIDDMIYEPLARPNPRTFAHEGRLAERWEIAPDKLSITFFLRQDARWHDGVPFTAADVVFTFDKLRDEKSKTVAVRSYLEPLASYEAVDAHTVRFVLKRPYWFAFDAIAETFIYPKHVYEKGDFNTHPANRAPVGIGRMKFQSWRTGDEITVVKNPDFFGEKAKLDRIVFKYVPDATVRLQMLRRGDVDVVERITPEQWRELANDDALAAKYFRLRHVPASLQWIGWNEDKPLFKDPQVRRALTMLIDRDDIVQNLRLGIDQPAASWFYPGSREFNTALKPIAYDPDGARELLKEAGYSDSDGDGFLDKDGQPFSFTFLYPTVNAFYEQLATLVQGDFKKAGIKVETSRLEWAAFMERLRRHEFDACSLLWALSPRSDPYQIWHSSEAAGGSNFVSFRNPEADKLLEDARGEFDDEKRAAMYRRFAEILYEQQPYTMLFHRYSLSVVSKQLGGVYSTPYGVLRYDELYRLGR